MPMSSALAPLACSPGRAGRFGGIKIPLVEHDSLFYYAPLTGCLTACLSRRCPWPRVVLGSLVEPVKETSVVLRTVFISAMWLRRCAAAFGCDLVPACTRPLKLAHEAQGVAFSGTGRTVPCGRCIACRINHSNAWALRIRHEAKLHDVNSFLTLTYSDEAIPFDLGLSKREFQLFLKRLRHKVPSAIRFFGCGEYGETTARPHYHTILFGADFAADRQLWKTTKSGYPLYRSELLERVWGFGMCYIGEVTVGSAAYVARYNLKRAVSWRNGERYERINLETGESWQVEPEFLLMSRRPGIGSGWWDRYKSDVFPSEFIVVDGKRRPIPAYYRRLYEKSASEDGLTDNEIAMLRLTAKPALRRRAVGLSHPGERSADRRAVRDEVLHRGAPQPREYDDQ